MYVVIKNVKGIKISTINNKKCPKKVKPNPEYNNLVGKTTKTIAIDIQTK